MTIAINGPAGYEQQYRTTVLIGLLLYDEPLSIFVEEIGQEDATIRIDRSSKSIKIDIQIKSGSTPVDTSTLAEILATFPKDTYQNCLFQRLASDSDAIAIVVFGGRCLDAINPLIVHLTDLSIEPRLTDPLKHKEAKGLLKSISEVYAGIRKPTELQSNRNSVCAGLQKTPLSQVFEIARRIYIIENLRRDEVIDRIQHILSHKFQIPLSIAGRVADTKLRGLVEHARDNRCDLMPLLRNEVQKHQSGIIAPLEPYIKHGIEDELYNEISNSGIILLTGPPRCGKTQLAYAIAHRAQIEGANVRVFVDVSDTERFLFKPAPGETRLAVLEDPLGKSQLVGNAPDHWDRLVNLLSRRLSNRSLIVTSRADLLSFFHNSMDPKTWSVAGEHWRDFGSLISSEFRSNIWRAWANRKGRDVLEVDELARRFASGEITELQAGQISHLANSQLEELHKRPNCELESVARVDADELGRDLCSSASMAEVLRVLAITASPTDGPREQDLTFFLNNGANLSRPGLRPEQPGASLSEFPGYPLGVQLGESSKADLAALQKRNGIVWQGDRCRFTHAYWQKVAHYALSLPDRFAKQNRVEVANRAMLGLDTISARNAVHSFGELIKDLTSDSPDAAELVRSLLEARYSLFPRIGDAAISVLLENLGSLKLDLKKIVVEAAAKHRYSDLSLSWRDDIAWFSESACQGHPLYLYIDSKDQIDKVCELLRATDAEKLSTEQLFKILVQMGEAVPFKSEHLEYGLSNEEAMIRAEAGYLAAKHDCDTRPDLVTRGLSDPHPMVFARTMEGLSLSWRNVSSKQKEEWLSLLTHRLSQVGYGIVGLMRLTNFKKFNGWDPEWYEGKTAPWDFWTICMTAALSADPGYLPIDDPHLYDLMVKAVKGVQLVLAIKLCKAWLSWTERRVRHGMTTDYGGAIADTLMEVSQYNSEARGDVVDQMLRQSDTALQVLLLRDLCRHWDFLSSNEQESVKKCLCSKRQDVRWLKAEVLVDGKAPNVLLEEITGVRSPLSQPAHVLIDGLSDELLDDALHVYLGHPQPLWYIGTHHINKDIWEPIILNIARHPEHRLFNLCMREVLHEEDRNPKSLEVWRELCGTADEKLISMLFEALLAWTVQITGAGYTEHWRAIVDSPGAKKFLSNWSERASEFIEGIDNADNLDMMIKALPGILDKTPGDKAFLVFIQKLSKAKKSMILDDKVQKEFASLINEILIHSPPRSVNVIDYLNKVVQPLPDLLAAMNQSRLRELRTIAIDEGSRQCDSFDDHYTLPNWVEMSRENEGRS